jgi:hypothetical protein
MLPRPARSGVAGERETGMPAALKAGFTYFLVVFAVGFLLGTARVLAIVPRLGETTAVLLELPLMRGASWIASRRLVDRFEVPATIRARAAMGAFAFALLMAAELGVSILAFGRTAAEHATSYASARGALGLAAQIGFALLPLLPLLQTMAHRPEAARRRPIVSIVTYRRADVPED